MKLWYAIFPAVSVCAAGIGYMSCSRDSLPNTEDQLVGRWEWVESSTSTDDLKLTPAITGHTSAMEFDRRGRACFFQDGSMTGAALFTVRHSRLQKKHVLIYRGYKGQQYYTIVGDRLYLQDTDGKQSGHVFSRVMPVTATSSAQ